MDDLLQQGITAYKAGKPDEARKIFITAIKQSPNNEHAWGWMYQVSNNDQERIHCLKQILRINPKSEKANQLLNQLLTPPLTPISPLSIQVNSPEIMAKKSSKPVVETKSKGNKQGIFVWIVLGLLGFICVCGMVLLSSSNSSNEKGCVKIDVFYCNAGSYSSEVKGTVTNACNYKLRYVKVISEVYSKDGKLLDSDPEYIDNLSPSEIKNFESPLTNPNGQVTNCKAHVEEASK